MFLPPLKSSRKIQENKTTLSPKRSKNQSVNLYNKGGIQVFSKSPRFQEYGSKQSVDSFFYRASSDFEVEGGRKGTSIGYGDKYDFTRDHKLAPGVGRYEIPSTWDKYK